MTSLGILYSGEESLNPIGYSVSDWGNCKINRKSTSGYVFTMARGAVSWKSKKQDVIALSSCEAEYRAFASSVKEAIISIEYSHILLQVDNQGAIKMSKNDSSTTRTKHIDIQYHFVRDSLSKNLSSIQCCPTSEMTADILTKPLPRALNDKFLSKIGLNSDIPLRACDRGGVLAINVEQFKSSNLDTH